MSSNNKSIAVIVPTNLIKGIMCASHTGVNRSILNGFRVRGTARTNDEGYRVVSVRLTATDSYVLVDFEHAVSYAKGDQVDVPDEFDWVIRPTDKLVGASDYVRIEPREDGKSADVRTYKGTYAWGMAVSNMSPTSYHVWEMPKGRFPDSDRIYSDSVTTCGNVTVDAAVWGKAEKALTTAYGATVQVTLCGIANNGGALELAVHRDDNRVARAVVMPTAATKIERGTVTGADPAELKALQGAYDEQLRINRKLVDERDEYERRIAELEAALDHAIDRAEPGGESHAVEPDAIEAPEPNTVIEPTDCVGIVPASQVPTCTHAYYVPDGCTIKISKVGNAWLEGPKAATKASRDALKADGWKWAPQRKQWWRKVA